MFADSLLSKFSIIVFLGCFLCACAENNTTSDIVRNGGTMILSVGAFEELDHAILSAGDLSAQITDINNLTASVKVREAVPINSDRSSDISQFEYDDIGAIQGLRNGFSGFWLVVVDLVHPADDVATNFLPGNATLEIAGLPFEVSRAVEIVSGDGSINPIKDYNGANTLAMLRPASQVRYTVSDPFNSFTEANLLGALEFSFDYPSASVASLEPSQWPRVVTASNDDNLQISGYTTSDSGVNTLRVMILNPEGIGRATDANKDTLRFYQASEVETVRFGVVFPSEVGATPFSLGNGTVIGYDIEGVSVDISALSIATPVL